MRAVGAVAFWVLLTLATAVIGILGSPALLMGESASRAVAKFWARTTLILLEICTGITHKVEGAENMPRTGAIVGANHQSMWETVALYVLLPKPVIVLKRELTRIPVWGWFLRAVGNVAIDRGSHVKALRDMQRTAAERVKDGYQVIIFPEGTRLKPGKIADYRPGVAGAYAAAEAPAYPVAHDSGKYWVYPEISKNPGVITIKFLPSIDAGHDRKTFLVKLQAAIDGARPDLMKP
ncbi:MAG: 1-acyl-sn-glycerol-3-phosphate acyltransferase [Marinicaulis sp.]|nr:1-acyl-sn-glycerol-3-phosphate acyltransferase [Marinicaulis sp.]NNL90491.1 1-acyl-sn-glycerol-3-phosphate acyltransferase [Marinicaulis sp.]